MRAQNSENHVARIILAWVPGNFNYILYGWWRKWESIWGRVASV
jgi:hypothetical protein